MAVAFRVLWAALVHLYDESLLMIRANVIWFIGSLPLFLLVLATAWLFVPSGESDAGPIVWPLLLAGFLVLVVPSPFAVGLHALTAEIVTGETPEFAVFWSAIRRWWKEGLAMFAIGGVVLGGLIFNAAFYLSTSTAWLQMISVLCLYAILYWITLQGYLLPLLVISDDGADSGARHGVPLLSLYKRAAILALANPIFSLVLVLNSALTMLLSVIAIPIYPIVAAAYVALVGARGLRQLREKYLPSDAEEVAE